MILILTTDTYEQTTDPVVQYLTYCGAGFLRLSVKDLIFGRSDVEVDIMGKDIKLDGVSILQEINVVWFRRMLPLDAAAMFDKNDGSLFFASDIKDEALAILEHMYEILGDKVWLPRYSAIRLNKLAMLRTASLCGVRVPRSRLINRRERLLAFYDECGGNLITKPCHRNVFYVDGGNAYVAFTKRIGERELRAVPERFFLSLYQEYIRADFELRVFYLDGRFFTLSSIPAVASEDMPEDVKLARMADKVNHACYLLPLNVSDRLDNLLQTLELDICTLDLLVKDGEHFLLDVNPLGQFLYESEYGNGYLEKLVADWLRSKDYVEKKKHGKEKKAKALVYRR